jgi:catechol 2,3-dioxygenase-like lactoylglutathione lyase family enzyme
MAFTGLGRIGQIHLSVSDVDRSVAFYRDILGIPFLFQVHGRDMAFFECGNIRLYLGRPESPEYRSTALIYFTVDDIDEAHRVLAERGVPFLGPPHVVHRTETTELLVAFFSDRDANHVAVMEERPRPTEG